MITFGGQYKQEEFVDETNGMLVSGVPGAVKSVDRWIAALFAEVKQRLARRRRALRLHHRALAAGERVAMRRDLTDLPTLDTKVL